MIGAIGARLRALPPIAWVGILLAVAASGLAVRMVIVSQGYETTDDAFVEGTLSRIAARISGQIVELAVEEHQHVTAGQVLVRLDPADAEIHLASARADLAAAHNRMHAAEAAAAAAEAERKAAEVELWRAERELERVEALADRGASSPQDLDGAKAARDAAVARVLAAKQRAEAERALLGNEAPLRQAEASLRRAELEVSRTEVRAPYDGTVGRRAVEHGAIVAAGQTLLALISDEPSYIMANFKETQLARMHVGSPATVEIDALPGLVWNAHVDSFSPATGALYALIPSEPASGNFTKVVQRVPVRIVLDELDEGEDEATGGFLMGGPMGPLPLGLSADVRVSVR